VPCLFLPKYIKAISFTRVPDREHCYIRDDQPVILKFEGSGTVVAAGPGLLPRLWLGKRMACAVSSFGGTWAEYLTHATLCVPLRNNLSLEQGAMLLVNPMTALAFFDIVKRGKHAAITSTAAASALGRMIVRLSQRHRVPVIAVVLSLVLCRMRVCFSVLRFHC